MPLFARIDVNLPEDPKVVEVGPDAEHLYIRSILLAKRIMTDGKLAVRQAERLCSDLTAVEQGLATPKTLCGLLVASGLWIEEEDGYRIAAWLSWNKSAEAINEKQRQEAERKAKWREARRDENATRRDGGTDASRDANATHGERQRQRQSERQRQSQRQSEEESERGENVVAMPKRKGSRIPDPFEVTDAMIAWAAREVPTLDWVTETRTFKDYWLSVPGAKGLKADWPATWRTWMRRAATGAWR